MEEKDRISIELAQLIYMLVAITVLGITVWVVIG